MVENSLDRCLDFLMSVGEARDGVLKKSEDITEMIGSAFGCVISAPF